MKFINLLFILLIFTTTHAQVDESKKFLLLYTDSAIYGNNISYEKPLFGKDHFIIDEKKYDTEDVMFYQKDSVVFANLKNVGALGYSSFAARTVKGKINLFERKDGKGENADVTDYYNKGYGPLKKLKYNNLLFEVSDNKNSIASLQKFKSVRSTQATLAIIGGALIGIGIVTMLNATKTDKMTKEAPSTTPSFILLGGGVTFMFAEFMFSLEKPKHLKKAVEEYNK